MMNNLAWIMLKYCLKATVWVLSCSALVLAAPAAGQATTRDALASSAPRAALADAASAAASATHTPLASASVTARPINLRPGLAAKGSASTLLLPESEPELLGSSGPLLRATIIMRWVTAGGFYVQRDCVPLDTSTGFEDTADASETARKTNPEQSPSGDGHVPCAESFSSLALIDQPEPSRTRLETVVHPGLPRRPVHTVAQAPGPPVQALPTIPSRAPDRLDVSPRPAAAPSRRLTPAMVPAHASQPASKGGRTLQADRQLAGRGAPARKKAQTTHSTRPTQRAPGELAYALEPLRPSLLKADAPDQNVDVADSHAQLPAQESTPAVAQPDRAVAFTGGSGAKDRRQRGGVSGEHTAALASPGRRTLRAEGIYGNLVTDFRAQPKATPPLNRDPKEDVFLPYLGVVFSF